MAQQGNRLIINSFGAAAILLLGYAGLIQIWQPVLQTAPTVATVNRLFIERYIYGPGAPVVITGSSLSQRMSQAALGPGVANLALSGEGALTGLALAVAHPAAPQRVYIEINQLILGADNPLLSSVLSEPMFSWRRHVAVLRKGYQPATLLYALVRGNKTHDMSMDQPMTKEQHRGLIAANRFGLSRQIPERQFNAALRQLRADVSALRRRGTQPVFFEMPIDPELRNLPVIATTRAMVLQTFPPSSNCWVRLALKHGETVDGIHLRSAGATEAAQLLRKAPCERG